MYVSRRSAVTVLSISLLFLTILATADKRIKNIDIILAVDKSLSMADNHKIEAVKSYIDSWLLKEVVIPGDLVDIVTFYGKAELLVSQTINGPDDLKHIEKLIGDIGPTGRFTDIGNALEVMKSVAAKHADDGRKKFVLMMTDGIQEAPPFSKYFDVRGKFNYKFKETTRTIEKQGWKIEILGIGSDTGVKELAKEVSGSYAEITDTLSTQNLKKETENFLGTLTLSGGARLSPVGRGGASTLTLELKSEGYSQEVKISLSEIQARIPSRPSSNILPSPYVFTVAPSGNTRVEIPVRFPSDLPAGKANATLAFSFLAGERFTPSEVTAVLSVPGLVESYWWAGLIGLVVLALLVLAVLMGIRRLTAPAPVHFFVSVGGKALQEAPLTIKAGLQLYLNELDGVFSLMSGRNARSIARFRVKDSRLGFDVLKADRFPKLTVAPEDVIGRSFVVKSENGRNLELKVSQGGGPPAVATPEAKPAAPKTGTARAGAKKAGTKRAR